MASVAKSRAVAGVGLAAMAVILLSGCKQTAPAATAAAPTASRSAPGETTAQTFTATPDVLANVQAAPRLEGDSPAIRAINADLAVMDASARENAAGCEGGGYTRSVTQPMTGPGYVAYAFADEYECGGPYPSQSQTMVTYDLATGQRVDWIRTMPAWALTGDSLEGMPAGSAVTFHSVALAQWYSRKMLASADKDWLAECRAVFDPASLNEGGFKVWADAGNSGIAVSPELPHVVQACGEQATLSADDMRAAGVPAAMIQALAQAGEDRNWLPYQEGA